MSYYNFVDGNLQPNKTALVEDVNSIQQNTSIAIQELIKDLHGPNFIIGEEEEALQLVPTTDVIDQANYNYDESDANQCWMSFYDTYLRQSIYITKSSIESVTVQMVNNTNISTTIYAEIRDTDGDLWGETSVLLDPTVTDESTYKDITFAFSLHHIPVGQYYFIIRPVDISATDLTYNGDETIYDTITSTDFLIRYDTNGTYHQDHYEELESIYDDDSDEVIDSDPINETSGLQVSYNGSDYIDAYLVPNIVGYEDYNEFDINDNNYDLYFEEAFSSGLTYLIKPGEAIVLGQKVDSFDTHVKIDGPSTLGNRTDLVVLTTEGKLEVIQGKVYSGETEYPTFASEIGGLPLAYITVYQNGDKVALIEQNDENGMTRHRDILERLRRVENKLNYQVENNSPSRIQYMCEVDPVMYHDGLSQDEYNDTESSYNMGLSTNDDGDNVIVDKDSITLMWSIIKSSYTYAYEKTTTSKAYCQVFNVDGPVNGNSLPKNTQYVVATGKYMARLSSSKINKGYAITKKISDPIKGETLTVQVKNSKGAVKYTKKVTTNSKGEAQLNLNNAKLPAGTYTVITTIDGNTIKTKYVVHKKSYTVTNPGQVIKEVTLKDRYSTKEKVKLDKTSIITGNDGFDNDDDKISIDTKNGVIELAKKDVSKDKYTKNKPLSTNKSKKPYYNSKVQEYKVYSNKQSLKSEFPVLHLNITRDTHIKTITPHIKKLKNMKSIGIILFKNDQILNMKAHKRKLVEKKFTGDPVFKNIYKREKKVTKTPNKKTGIQELSDYPTFKVDKKIEAGTYSLMIYGKLKSGASDGGFFLREFDTHANLEEYGMAAKCTGSSNLSLLKMSTSNLTDYCWNVVFEQRKDKYVEQGTVTSVARPVMDNIVSCKAYYNIETPSGCRLKLQVSNNGGATWTNVDTSNTSAKVTFSGTGNILKWRMIMSGNEENTPRLYYKNKKQYAIKFVIGTESVYVPWEDYRRCYQTPMLNANSITRTFVSNQQITNRFSEWEFARIFMLDESNDSNVDICISYDDTDYSTNVSTYRDNWGRKIFFSQIFADLKLSDFSTSSVNYNNYGDDVEFDEHNYRFKMESEYIQHNNSAINLASPSLSGTGDYTYGNINGDNTKDFVDSLFYYSSVNDAITYNYREADEPHIYSGSILKTGPYILSTFNQADSDTKNKSITKFSDINDGSEDNKDKYKYIINGITFEDALRLDETKAILELLVYPVCYQAPEPDPDPNATTTTDDDSSSTTPSADDDSSSTTPSADDNNSSTTTSTDDESKRTDIPSGTFELVISLTTDGTLSDDNSNGIVVPIGGLKGNAFNTVYVDLSDNIDAFEESGIRSIGIRMAETGELYTGEGIGLGLLGADSYNRLPYVPYMYTQNLARLQWTPISNNGAECYNICRAKSENGTYYEWFYPSYDKTIDHKADNITISNSSISKYGEFAYAYRYDGTAINEPGNGTLGYRKGEIEVDSIVRSRNEIKAYLKTNKTDDKITDIVSTTTSSNAVVFKFPAGKTGNIFKIDTDIPFNIYDLIDVEYYIFHSRKRTDEPEEKYSKDNTPIYRRDDDTYTYQYRYDGSISKGDITIKFYATTDITNAEPVETFALPAWGRTQTNAKVKDKTVHAWFKKRKESPRIKSIVLERNNPTQQTNVPEVKLVLSNMLLYNADVMPALGPQMVMRIYPEKDLEEIQIRKVGCIYRL